MILVLLGTQNNSFHRLLYELEKCLKDGIIKDSVVVQCGYTKFISKYMELVDFIPIEEFDRYIESADLVITHGGVGSIINSIKSGKKVIAVPRLSKFNEHVNDHQVQIIKMFDKKGFIKGVFNMVDLSKAIMNIERFIPVKYVGNNKTMLTIISDYIDNN